MAFLTIEVWSGKRGQRRVNATTKIGKPKGSAAME
jgi:hypothetical protein